MDIFNILKNKLLTFNLPEQVDRRGGELSSVTFRFARKKAVVGIRFCTKLTIEVLLLEWYFDISIYLFFSFLILF